MRAPTLSARHSLFLRAAALSTLLVLFSVGPCGLIFLKRYEAQERSVCMGQAILVGESLHAQADKGLSGNTIPLAVEARRLIEAGQILFVSLEDSESGRQNVLSATGWSEVPIPEAWAQQRLDRRAAFESNALAGSDGQEILRYSATILHGKFPRGCFHLGVPLDRFRERLEMMRYNLIVSVGSAAFAGIAASFLLARRVARPLQALCDLARNIANGELRARAKVRATGEFRELVQHMNWMADNLLEKHRIISASNEELEHSNRKLRERVEAEHLLARISGEFLKADTDQLDLTFRESLRLIAAHLDCPAASVHLLDAKRTVLTAAWEWSSAETSTDEPPPSLPAGLCRWALRQLAQKGHFAVTSPEDLPSEAQMEQQFMRRHGVRSVLVVPIRQGSASTGYLSVRSSRSRGPWTPEETQFLSFAAGILSNAVARREAARDRENLQAQLLQSQKMEAVGKLSGGIAHDFNNMLVPIVGYSDTLLSAVPADSPLANDIREIKRAAESAAALTRQLLTFSRKQISQRREENPNELIRRLKKMLGRLIGENIELETRLPDDVWTVSADAGQIEQCLVNLCVNARHAMPDGGRLSIVTEMVDSEDASFAHPAGRRPQGLFVRLSVTDTGCGMSEETLQHIFEPFFSTKGHEGTGLGLSVVHGVIEEHGGWIRVRSAPGAGTTFSLYLPALHEPVGTKAPEIITAAVPLARGSGQRILLIEDEAQVLAFVRAALSKHGYEVLTAENGAAARAAFARAGGSIDLVMSDVVLPDATGVELLEEFLTARPDLKALLSSGYSEKNVVADAVLRRGVAFLHKPYNLSQLLDTVRDTLKAPAADAAAAR